MGKYIGLDLGGTNIKGAIVDSELGIVYGVKSIKTMSQEGHEAVIQRMADFALGMVAESTIAREEILGIGIGLPGRGGLPGCTPTASPPARISRLCESSKRRAIFSPFSVFSP